MLPVCRPPNVCCVGSLCVRGLEMRTGTSLQRCQYSPPTSRPSIASFTLCAIHSVNGAYVDSRTWTSGDMTPCSSMYVAISRRLRTSIQRRNRRARLQPRRTQCERGLSRQARACRARCVSARLMNVSYRPRQTIE